MLHRNEKELCQVAYTYIHTWLCDIVASLSLHRGAAAAMISVTMRPLIPWNETCRLAECVGVRQRARE
jgi:hypothetical protein